MDSYIVDIAPTVVDGEADKPQQLAYSAIILSDGREYHHNKPQRANRMRLERSLSTRRQI